MAQPTIEIVSADLLAEIEIVVGVATVEIVESTSTLTIDASTPSIEVLPE